MDTLHILLARKAKCDAVVTWNKKHLELIKDINVLCPNEL